MPPRVIAIDQDGTFPNNQVHYQIADISKDKDSFTIDSQSGEVFTKEVFDRERKSVYSFSVEVSDGAPSARPNRAGRPNFGKNI